MHTPLIYTPNLIVPTYPFCIYVPGTTPNPPGCSTLLYHTADTDEHEEDLIPAETGDEALKAELPIGALLNKVNVCTVVAYEANVWRKLHWGSGQGATGGSVMESMEVVCGNGCGWALWVCRSREIAYLDIPIVGTRSDHHTGVGYGC